MTNRRIPIATLSRVIVDNDYAGDPDGLLALAHQLLTESTTVVAITGTTLTPPHSMPGGDPGSARAIARELVARLGVLEPFIPDDTPVAFADQTEVPAAALAIVAEAHRDSDTPLFVTCGGPLTNIAAALRHDPSIADRLTLCWIGGGGYPDGAWEYNLALDRPAAQFVFNESRVAIHQFPQPTYRQCAYSNAELEDTLVLSGGAFGAWLYERFTSPPSSIRIGDSWPQGDSPVILTTALGVESSVTRTVPSPWITDGLGYTRHPESRDLVLYERVDTRLLFGDFAARLRLHAARATRNSAMES